MPSQSALIDRATTALDQPEPVAVTDEALASFTAYFCRNYPGPDTIIHRPEWHAPKIFHAAADAIARWGRPTITPIPLSERLPGPEDCAPWPGEPDVNHWCWLGRELYGGWEWSQVGAMDVSALDLRRVLAGGGWTHWAPHWAISVPKQEAGT